MGPVRGLIACAIATVAAGPALAEVCDKAGPVHAQPVPWIIAVLMGLALWRGGHRWPVAASIVALLFGALEIWTYTTEDGILRQMTESMILEGCKLPFSVSIPLYLVLAALPLLRFRWRPA